MFPTTDSWPGYGDADNKVNYLRGALDVSQYIPNEFLAYLPASQFY
jgi:hypothetical protein